MEIRIKYFVVCILFLLVMVLGFGIAGNALADTNTHVHLSNFFLGVCGVSAMCLVVTLIIGLVGLTEG